MSSSRNNTRERTKTILESFSVGKHEFGVHWDDVKESRYDETLSDDGLEKLCKFLVVATRECGLPADIIPLRYMQKPLNWRFSVVEQKARKLCEKIRGRLPERQVVTEHYADPEQEGQDLASRPEDLADDRPDADGQREDPVGPWHPPMAAAGVPQQPPDPLVPPLVAIGKNALNGFHAVTYHQWLGPQAMRLREEPPTNQQQILIPFTGGKKLFPP